MAMERISNGNLVWLGCSGVMMAALPEYSEEGGGGSVFSQAGEREGFEANKQLEPVSNSSPHPSSGVRKSSPLSHPFFLQNRCWRSKLKVNGERGILFF